MAHNVRQNDAAGGGSGLSQAPLTGTGALGNEYTFQNGTAAGQIWQWDGSAWGLVQPDGAETIDLATLQTRIGASSLVPDRVYRVEGFDPGGNNDMEWVQVRASSTNQIYPFALCKDSGLGSGGVAGEIFEAEVYVTNLVSGYYMLRDGLGNEIRQSDYTDSLINDFFAARDVYGIGANIGNFEGNKLTDTECTIDATLTSLVFRNNVGRGDGQTKAHYEITTPVGAITIEGCTLLQGSHLVSKGYSSRRITIVDGIKHTIGSTLTTGSGTYTWSPVASQNRHTFISATHSTARADVTLLDGSQALEIDGEVTTYGDLVVTVNGAAAGNVVFSSIETATGNGAGIARTLSGIASGSNIVQVEHADADAGSAVDIASFDASGVYQRGSQNFAHLIARNYGSATATNHFDLVNVNEHITFGVPYSNSKLQLYYTNAKVSLPKIPIDNAVAALGTTQGTATALTEQCSIVTSATAGVNDGVILPSPETGMLMYVINNSGAAINLYPSTGVQINGAAANTPLAMAAGERRMLIADAYSGDAWNAMILMV